MKNWLLNNGINLLVTLIVLGVGWGRISEKVEAQGTAIKTIQDDSIKRIERNDQFMHKVESDLATLLERTKKL